MLEILNIVKMLLGIKGCSKNEILELYINIVTQKILNYCNISELPEELKYEAAQMVVEAYQRATDDTGTTGKVSSITEAGRSVSFDSSSASMAAETAISERRTQLNRFKLVYR